MWEAAGWHSVPISNGKASRGGTLVSSDTLQTFSPAAFLASAGLGRTVIELKPRENFFSQGDHADSVFFLQKGRGKVTVLSKGGKEATITLLSQHDFVGEEALASDTGLRMATATAVTSCTALKIMRAEMIRAMHEQHTFSDLFLSFLLARSMRVQADLIDQLFNSSEKRLARILLLMAEFGAPGEPEMLIPPITQDTLADMIGATRSRVSFFMNRFRKLGLIEYNGRIRVNKSLLNLVLHDQLPDDNARKPRLPDGKATRNRSAKSSAAAQKLKSGAR
jgi:CRP/FNR family transcriptional regulator, cyclic AMP receptor protein